jgi:uncharacterized membrane protein YheB (UPF0754 family)
MVLISYLSIPLIGAIIGWITNVLAIKLLFRPYEPIKLPLLNYSIQGLIPKRKAEIAQSIGQVIEEELISIDDILQLLKTSKFLDKTVGVLSPILKQTILHRIPHFIPNTIKEIIASLITDVLASELPGLLEQFRIDISSELKQSFSFAEIIQQKINDMDWTSLEHIILSIAKRELRHIEILGGVLGFMIGLVQLIISFYLNTF